MKALIRYSTAPQTLRIQDIPMPEIEEGQVLLKVQFTGICGRDLEHFNQELPAKKVPYLPGHEFSATVEKVSPQMQERFKVGDRVTCETVVSVCEKCLPCQKGHYNLCKSRKNIGGSMVGAFAPYIAVSGKFVHKIPDHLSYQEAAMMEPCAVSYNAVMVNSQITANDFVVIFGAGTIGILCAQMSKLQGARVCMVGLPEDKARLEKAKSLGVDEIVFAGPQAVEEINKLSPQGAQVVIDTVGGVDATMNQALEIVTPGGQITKVGWFMKTQNIKWDELIRRNIRLQGSFSHNYEIWEKVIELVSTGAINVKDMISNVFPIEQWDSAFEQLKDKQAIKILLTPQ